MPWTYLQRLEGDKEIEVIENMEDYCDGDNSCRHENEVHIEEPSPPSPVAEFLNKFLIFFQLKFNLPERGLQLLLQIFWAFMTIICKRNGNGSAMRDELPTSVYMLRKQTSINKQFIQYCICTKCIDFLIILKKAVEMLVKLSF